MVTWRDKIIMSVGAKKCWSRGWLYVVAILMVLLLNPIQAKAAIPEATDGFFVNDYAEVLSDETETEIKNKNYDLEEMSGAQIVVVTVDSSDGESYDEYCTKIFNKWGIGSSKLNNGFLLVLFIEDDDYYALQGSGIEKVITQNKIQNILNEKLEPYFAQQDYDGGVKAAFASFYDVINTHYVKNPVNNKSWGENVKTSFQDNIQGFLQWVGIVLGIVVFLFVITLPNRWRGRRTTSYDTHSYGSGYGRRRRRHHHHMPPPPPRHHHHLEEAV